MHDETHTWQINHRVWQLYCMSYKNKQHVYCDELITAKGTPLWHACMNWTTRVMFPVPSAKTARAPGVSRLRKWRTKARPHAWSSSGYTARHGDISKRCWWSLTSKTQWGRLHSLDLRITGWYVVIDNLFSAFFKCSSKECSSFNVESHKGHVQRSPASGVPLDELLKDADVKRITRIVWTNTALRIIT